MYVLIYDNQVAGKIDDPENLPYGFSVYEVAEAPLDSLYFDGQQVLPKPPQPDPLAYWSIDHWEVPVMATPEPVEVYEPFSDSPLFQDAWAKAQTDVKTLAIFATALYADTKGDQALLEFTKTQLEDLLTQP